MDPSGELPFAVIEETIDGENRDLVKCDRDELRKFIDQGIEYHLEHMSESLTDEERQAQFNLIEGLQIARNGIVGSRLEIEFDQGDNRNEN